MKRCILIFLIALLSGCTQKKKIEVQRSFYYWKSSFRLSPIEASTLTSLSIEKLYIRFFDLEWNSFSETVQPVAQIRFSNNLPRGVSAIPVVFITNEAIEHSNNEQIDSLAQRMVQLVNDISSTNELILFPEIQIDCDWTAGTKDSYFRLLQNIKKQPWIQGKTVSATIRLHQVKYRERTGVPPADKGLLMCYNMGNLPGTKTKNSILDPAELAKYTGRLDDYPLQLDIALPIFDWFVWFHHDRFKGLLHIENLDGFPKKEKITFEKDTVVNNYNFEKGDWLRYEGSDPKNVKKAADMIRKKFSSEKINVVLYHLDEVLLKKYSHHDLKSFFNSFY